MSSGRRHDQFTIESAQLLSRLSGFLVPADVHVGCAVAQSVFDHDVAEHDTTPTTSRRPRCQQLRRI